MEREKIVSFQVKCSLHMWYMYGCLQGGCLCARRYNTRCVCICSTCNDVIFMIFICSLFSFLFIIYLFVPVDAVFVVWGLCRYLFSFVNACLGKHR